MTAVQDGCWAAVLAVGGGTGAKFNLHPTANHGLVGAEVGGEVAAMSFASSESHDHFSLFARIHSSCNTGSHVRLPDERGVVCSCLHDFRPCLPLSRATLSLVAPVKSSVGEEM